MIVFYDTLINDYYVIDSDDTADFRIGSDILASGKEYTLKVKAVTAYKNHSDIELKFMAK